MNLLKFSLVFTFIQLGAWSYTNFISYGYQSCLTCHYNPFGGGPLTDYGRVVGSTSISDNKILKKSLNGEDRAEIAQFLYGVLKNDYIKGHMNYRGLYLKNNLGEDTSESEWINMMANVGFTVRPTKKNDFILVGTLDYAPESNLESDEGSTYRSREHYMGYRFNEKHGIYLGMMDKVYGLRVPDHNSYSKTSTNLTMNDGAHAFLYHANFPKFELGLQYFLGNLSQEEDVRPSGFSTTFEYNLSQTSRLGLSYLSQSNSYISQTSYAIHTKLGSSKGSSILAEYGITTKNYTNSGSSNTSNYLFLQNFLKVSQGLYTIVTAEYFKQDTEEDDKVLKIGPALQYFPFVGVELRVDFYNYRTISTTSYSNDTWTLAGQVHLWL